MGMGGGMEGMGMGGGMEGMGMGGRGAMRGLRGMGPNRGIGGFNRGFMGPSGARGRARGGQGVPRGNANMMPMGGQRGMVPMNPRGQRGARGTGGLVPSVEAWALQGQRAMVPVHGARGGPRGQGPGVAGAMGPTYGFGSLGGAVGRGGRGGGRGAAGGFHEESLESFKARFNPAAFASVGAGQGQFVSTDGKTKGWGAQAPLKKGVQVAGFKKLVKPVG